MELVTGYSNQLQAEIPATFAHGFQTESVGISFLYACQYKLLVPMFYAENSIFQKPRIT